MRVLYRYLRALLARNLLPRKGGKEQYNGVIQGWGDYYDDVAN
jgi:hypothetical protein